MRRKYEQIAHGLCTCSNIILVYLELLQLKKLKLSFETVIKDLFIRVHHQCSYSLDDISSPMAVLLVFLARMWVFSCMRRKFPGQQWL
ncbi:hypothetical protein OIU76_023278 [Salix suchowensis]|uniref:Uncharacterized protein n=1 Tax=Salix suchowensis TaxID=1278906 RepID=A0ABQ9ALR7_9ROSI|nr:hypothetical protein OIU76_023278 [Salix suchowensis]KAJ6297015.1 hypothetical protein OIU78_022692 [Salix suchowensis]KAJ6348544.1 hypothetical protein OIU77_006173 [Salix suchowensis]